ncbi:hypothetical protein BH11BAC2_BH11BAC2_11410 [soil metagenome]
MSRKLLQWFFILTLGITLSSSKNAQASHAMGADLTYQCMGGNTYKVRLSFYRDCIGISAPANVYVNIKSASCGQNIGVTCYPIPGTGQQVTYLCPTALSTCNGGTFTGIQEWIYEGVITLPMQCVDWQFNYTLCCRNAAITTIGSPGSNTFYIYANLNNTISPCNSSPTFSNKPVPFACLGQQLCFNHGAVDPDGDSLVYSLVNPKQTATTNVSYLAPYTATNPLNSSPALQFNNATGDLCFTPQQLQVTVMAVLVQEYRNGVLIGSVVRDIQVTVLNCNNDLPTLTGINGTNTFNMTVCANTPFCFNIFSNDNDAGQQVSLFWNQAIPAATFTSAGSPHPTGTFCWTPTQADISGTPYCFTVRVNDDACPYTGSQTYSYCITVTGINVIAGPDQYIACSDQATVSANASGGSGTYTYLWSNGFTGPTQTVGVGTYIVTVSDGTCSSSDTINVISAFEPVAAFTWNGGCIFNPVQFTDQSSTAGGFSSWTWNFGDGTGSGLQNPTHAYGAPGTYNVSLTVQNIYGCVDTITQVVTISPPPVASYTVGTACAGSAVQFNNTSTPAGSLWNWTFSNGSTSTLQNPSVTIGGPGTYTGTLIVTDTAGCIDTVSQSFTINPNPIAAFTTTGTSCQNGLVTFTNTSSGGTSYSWTFGDGTTSTSQNPTHTYSSSGTYNVTLVVTNAFGCTATLSQSVVVSPPPFANAGPDVAVCIGSSVSLTATGGVSYTWNPGSLSGGTINVSPSGNTSYTVIVTDANGCTAIDTVMVTVNPLPVATVSPDQTICAGQSATLTAGGGVTYNWTPSGNTSSTISVTPGSSTTYAVNVIGANGCQATAFVNVTVRPLPVVSLPPAIFTCTGSSTVLNPGAGGTSYLWSNGATTPTISVNSQGTYSVTVTNQYGCTATASTVVTIGGQVVSSNNTISICQGQSATLDAGFPGSTYQWSTGANSQTISVNAAGVYQVTVTDASGCSGTVAHTVQLNLLPIVNFTPNDICINTVMNFNDISTVSGGTITAWSWNFGDGGVSQQQNPVHTYLTAGTFSVSLTVTTNSGCTATLTKIFTVHPLPVVNFTAANSCAGQSIQIVNTSSVSSGNISTWNWNFGDGTTGSTQNPSHTYSTAGTYNVTLFVTTAGGCSDSLRSQVTIYPQPTASFNAPAVCAGTPTIFTSTASGNGGTVVQWNWDFGNGVTSTLQNPTYTYAGAGTYPVTLSVTSSNGCVNTIVQNVSVLAVPVAEAGPSYTFCRGTAVTLNGTGGGTYNWTPGNLNTQSITVVAMNTTMYYVTVTSANGCTSRDSVNVGVRNLPTANAGPDKAICAGVTTSLTASGGVSYLWSNGAVTPTISVTPATTTNYIVTVTGANGCSSSDTVRVTVNPLPIANAGPDQAICTGTTATLTATGGTNYYWAVNGSSSNTIYVNPNAATTYAVTVTDNNGCSARDSVNITLNPVPVVALSNAFFCAGFSTVLDAANPGMIYDWSPTSETTQSITVSAPGIYTVVVTNSFGCQGTGTSNVIEGGTGLASNPLNVMACQGATVTLDAGNSGMTYLWSTGAVTQTITVGTTGTYDVTVTDPGGCSATFNNIVTMNPLPAVSFTSTNACLGFTTAFNNTSSIATGNIINWAWNFNNGYSSNLQNPTQVYSTSGAYTVTLVATSGAGCRDSVTLPVNVDPIPNADFTANTVCASEATQFNDASTIPSGNINSWSWDFGDGNTSNLQSPQHTYALEGTYIVTLVAYSTSGCADSIQYSVTVNPTPVADFNADPVCEGDSTQFINTSFINNGSISDINWDFGDGNTSTDVDPMHKYVQAGTYTVTLTVGSDLGCENVITKQVEVNSLPNANFTTSAVCDGYYAVFTDQSTVNNGTITGYYWNFGDSTSSNQQSPNHLFNGPGTYTITLIATSDAGCVAADSQSTVIYVLPKAAFGTTNVCLGSVTSFIDSSTISFGSINSWEWDFGDGSTSMNQNPSHTFTTSGTYDVQLVVRSVNGCTDTLKQSVNVYPVPVANYTGNSVCLNSITDFFDQSVVAGGGTDFVYNWSFGDNTTDTIANPSHMFNAAGVYNVSLTVTTPFGCSDTYTSQVEIFDLPVAVMTVGNVCLNSLSEFADGSYVPTGTLIGWNWDLGDSTRTAAQNPTHIYDSSGVFNIFLEVTSIHGCKSAAVDSIQIFNPPTPQIMAGTGCVNDNIAFIDSSTGSNNSITAWEWDFGSGNISTISNPSFVFPTSGTHTVTLSTTNASGCRASTTINIIVDPLPVAGFDAGSACADDGMQFQSTSTILTGSITGYQWAFGDSANGTSASQNPVYVYTSPGTYNVTLIVFSNNGCSDTITQQVIVNPLPVANFLQVNAAGCGPIPVQFTDSSYISMGNVVAWYWDFGDGETSKDQNPLHIYTQSGNYSVSLTVTSDMGCSATFTRDNIITVFPGPLAEFEPDPYTQSILNPNFNFINLSSGNLTNAWTFGDGTGSTVVSPAHTYRDTGNYVVILWITNSYGCVDSAMHTVRVEPEFTFWIPNAFTPNQDGENEEFNVKGISIADVKLHIYNRWGDQIFFSEGRDNRPWDGSVEGSSLKAQEGVYVYLVEVRDVWGKLHQKIGHVNLVR